RRRERLPLPIRAALGQLREAIRRNPSRGHGVHANAARPEFAGQGLHEPDDGGAHRVREEENLELLFHADGRECPDGSASAGRGAFVRRPIATLQLARARASAVARPIPWLAAATRATLPRIPRSTGAAIGPTA